jgi:hypothetical protein
MEGGQYILSGVDVVGVWVYHGGVLLFVFAFDLALILEDAIECLLSFFCFYSIVDVCFALLW